VTFSVFHFWKEMKGNPRFQRFFQNSLNRGETTIMKPSKSSNPMRTFKTILFTRLARATLVQAVILFVVTCGWAALGHDSQGAAAKRAAQASRLRAADVSKIPPLPAGVTELKFNEFFVSPVGPRGLELTEKLRELDGQKVRILGYMAHREAQPPGVFLLTPFPVQVHDHDNGLAEDFPASVVQVSVPTLREQPVPYAPGLMLLTGTLSLGNRPEPDGRVSLVRLELDPPPAVAKRGVRSPAKGAEKLMAADGVAKIPFTPALTPEQQGRGSASRH
jgi:hypothetical protein